MHTACWDGAACVVSCSGGRALSAAPPFRERARGPHSPRLSSRAAALHARHAADTSGALMSVHEQGGTLLGERCAGAACDSLVQHVQRQPRHCRAGAVGALSGFWGAMCLGGEQARELALRQCRRWEGIGEGGREWSVWADVLLVDAHVCTAGVRGVSQQAMARNLSSPTIRTARAWSGERTAACCMYFAWRQMWPMW